MVVRSLLSTSPNLQHKLLDLSRYSKGSSSAKVGEYYLTPHYDSAGNLLFYAALRDGINGIEYIIKAGQLVNFTKNLVYYTNAANLVYLNGIPTKAMIQVMSGDYTAGLLNMWGDALKSPEYYAYVANIFVATAINLPDARISYTSVSVPNTNVPNIRINNVSWAEYKTLISNKYTIPWKATSNAEVQILEIGNIKYGARLRASEWPDGFTIDYYKNGVLYTKFRFTY